MTGTGTGIRSRFYKWSQKGKWTMDILQYTEEHRIFRDALRKFFEKEVIPYIDEWEEAGIVPRSAWKKMGDQGFLCPMVPEEYGGAGADFL